MQKPRRREPETRLVSGVVPEPLTRVQVVRRFRGLIEDGARLRPAGRASKRPASLLTPRYLPRHEVRLFDASYFLGEYRFDDSVGFFVGFVVLGERDGERVDSIWPRIFYKDSSLLWRVASHFVRDGDSVWIGKGDTRVEERDGWMYRDSAEETANLPYELQFALDELSRRGTKRRDDAALELVVRAARRGRIEPYADFCAPRRRAAKRHRENGGRLVARFLEKGDPTSLCFARGYEPDFARGIVERGASSSAFFGGRVEKYRVLSANKRVQYLFFASPTHVWLGPPQLLTTELSTYGVRTLDVLADEDVFLPGFEYHEEGVSQIPAGFAGAPHPDNPDRADAAAWLEELPVIRAFRAKVLGRPAPGRASAKQRARLASAGAASVDGVNRRMPSVPSPK
ncbi:MAG: hypothetical protein HOP15_13650 [Planctomycetes bacterium]|nr:hypothetical protein [Planctomycetota bacterium]